MRGRQGRKHTYITETFESERGEYGNSKFMMDRTLYKGIKENDVSQIIDISSQAGQLGDKELLSETQELEAIVIEMRKKYDEIRTNTVTLEADIDKNRKAMDLLKIEEEKLANHNSSIKNNFQNAERDYECITAQVQARVYDLDIYKQMVDRMKKDILVMKKRNFDMNASLRKGTVKVKTLRQDEFNKTKLSFKCRDMLHSIERAVVTKQNERTTKINTFYDSLNKRHQNIVKRQEREREIDEVMMKAMSQKLQEEKQWINISLVNIFFKRFLKNKMEIIIQQNEQIEGAYHKVRSNTDIRDCKDLITRFLNRERDYGTLLGRISDKENRLQFLKDERASLQKTQNELMQIEDEILQGVSRTSTSTDPIEKQLAKLSENIFKIQQKKELLNKWVVKLFCGLTGSSRDQVKKQFLAASFREKINSALQELNKFTDKIMGDENNSDKINNAFMSTRPSAKIFQDEIVVRNRRIKTTNVDDSLIDADDKQAFYDGNSEADYLQYNRRVTKKNEQNRRFRIKTQAR